MFRKEQRIESKAFRSDEWLHFQYENKLTGPYRTDVKSAKILSYRYVGPYENVHEGWIRFLYETKKQHVDFGSQLKWMIHLDHPDWAEPTAMRIDLAIEYEDEHQFAMPIHQILTPSFSALRFQFFGDLLDLSDVYDGIFSLFLLPKQIKLADFPIREAFDAEKLEIYIPILTSED
jgi:hypothetical protein